MGFIGARKWWLKRLAGKKGLISRLADNTEAAWKHIVFIHLRLSSGRLGWLPFFCHRLCGVRAFCGDSFLLSTK